MKNKKILILLVLAVLLGFGYWQWRQNKTTSSTSMGQKLLDKAVESISYKCEIKNDSNNVSTVYVKNKMIRTQNDYQDSKSNLIIKNNQFWVWENSKTEGMTWVLPTGTQTEGQLPSLGGIASIGFNYQALLSGAKEMMNNCSPTSIDDKLFDVPTNVNFKDMSKLAEGVSELLDKSSQNENKGADMNNEQIQKMIQEKLQQGQ